MLLGIRTHKDVAVFEVNQQYVEKARRQFAGRKRTYWILGGSCAGKSTISQAIAARYALTLVDMDAQIYEAYMGRYRDDRHPANRAWLSAPNPLEWQLGLSAADFDAFYHAASAEYLDLLADDVGDIPPDQPLLIDGGISHPSLAAAIMPPAHIACLEISRAHRVETWETAEERAMMREWIGSLPDPGEKWQTFLRCDEQMSATMVREAQAHHISVLFREKSTPIQALVESVAAHLGIG